MMLPAQEPPMPLIIEHRARSPVRVVNIVRLIRASRSGILADLSRQRSRTGKDVLAMLADFRLGHFL